MIFLPYKYDLSTFVHFSASIFMAPYLHQFSSVVQKMHFLLHIWCKFCIITDVRTAPSNAAIWDEFVEQHQPQNIKKAPNLMPD